MDDRRDRRSRITLGVVTGFGTIAGAIASNFLADAVAISNGTTLTWAVAAIGAGVAVAVALISKRAADQGARAAARSRQDFRAVAERAVTSVEQTLPTADVPLEEEIAEVSAALSMTVGRLG
jgi:hypothetical protein